MPFDTHFLSWNITVKVCTTLGQPWCEGQSSLDEVPFLQYDNDNKATPLGDQGKAVHATDMWTDLSQRLEYVGQELRKMLANTKQCTTETSGQPTLQAIMLSKYEQGQIVDASWQFSISGKNSILNTMNMNWTLISLEAGGIMNDEEFINDLKVISTADCSHWLKELLKHEKEKPRSISRTTDVTQLTSATLFTSTSQFDNNKETIIIPVAISMIIPFTIIFIIIILLAIFIYMCLKKKFCFQGEMDSGLSEKWLYCGHWAQEPSLVLGGSSLPPDHALLWLVIKIQQH
ncbi:hypothetical protein A6R68_03489, partial [Neotoma lepida]